MVASRNMLGTETAIRMFMQLTTLPYPALRRSTASLKPVVKIFIACENQQACEQARCLRDQLRGSCGGRVDLSGFFWNFSLFQNEVLRKQAALEATEADMIIVSFSGRQALPLELKNWMEEWPTRREKGAAALVALLDTTRATGFGEKAEIAHLKGVAEKCSLDFFCNQTQDEEPDFFAAGPENPDSAVPALVSFGGPPFCRDWGINE